MRLRTFIYDNVYHALVLNRAQMMTSSNSYTGSNRHDKGQLSCLVRLAEVGVDSG